MATFMLVHGGGMGAWCWRYVIPELRGRGHDVCAVTMTGSGDRRHLLTKEISIETNVRDVASAIECEDLRDCVLVGHSQSGSILPGVAEALPDRVRELVFLDAALVRRGEALLAALGFMTAEQCAGLLAAVRSGAASPVLPIGEQQREAPKAFQVEVDPARVEWMMERLTDAPACALVAPAAVGYEQVTAPATYVACTHTMMQASHARAHETGWPLVEVDTDHGLMISEPERTAAVLHELVAGA